MKTDAFRFDPAVHRYTYGGRVVPSVTTLIRRGGWIEPGTEKYFTEESRWRGTAVHKACLDIDLGCFDFHIPTDERLAGYIESYLKWRHLTQPRWNVMEETKFSKRYRFCGIPDRVGYDRRGMPLIVDFKTGGPQKWHRYQLALYDILCDDIPWGMRRRMTLCLNKDGELPVTKEYEDRNDYTEAMRLIAA